MKNRMLKCAALVLFAESALNIGTDAYGMIQTELGRSIIEQSEVVNIASKRFDAKDSEKFINLIKVASNFGNEVSQVCFNALIRSQSITPTSVFIDWMLYSTCFIHEFFESGISQAKQINEHCQKHVFPSQSQLARQNIKSENFYINPNWTFDEARNTAIILPENIGENVIPSLFIQGAPMLQVNEHRNSISIVLTQKVLLGDSRFQPFWTNLICITGNPGDPLRKGTLHIIPPEEAQKAELTGGITLTSNQNKTPGTLFFKIDPRFDLTKITPTADQAVFSALLGLTRTFYVVHFQKEDLKTAGRLLPSTKQMKELIKEMEKIFSERYSIRKLNIPRELTQEPKELSHRGTVSAKKTNELTRWYIDFFFCCEGKTLSQMIEEFCGINSEMLLNWNNRLVLQAMLQDKSLQEQKHKLCEFARFVFYPENERKMLVDFNKELKAELDVSKTMELGSMVAHAIYDSSRNKSRLGWLKDNLCHFSLLYQFVDPNYIKNDYATILQGFLTQLPKLAWSQPEPNIFHEKIDYFLGVLKKCTPKLKFAHMKLLNLQEEKAKHILNYLQSARPRIQEISELYDECHKPNFTMNQFESLLHRKLLGRISKAERRDLMIKFLDIVKKRQDEAKKKGLQVNEKDQIQILLEIIEENQL